MKLNRISSIQNFNPEKIVSNPEVFDKVLDKRLDSDEWVIKKAFTDNGLFSERIFGRLDTEEDYSCKCGKYHGKFYLGTHCDECDSVVEDTHANMERIGWIDLQDNFLIKYIGYQFLEKIIGREHLKNIIKLPNMITIDGSIDDEAIEAKRNEAPEFKYYYYGLIKFKDHYKEILEYHSELNAAKKKKQDDQAIIDFISDPDNIFTTKIPVLPLSLRPAMRTADGLKLDEINIIYTNILKDLQILTNKTNNIELIQELTTETLQGSYLQLCKLIVDNIRSKGGLIRSQICGTRVNFSCRNIISPGKKDVGINEIVVPYLTFLELYKFEIINLIHRLKKISYVDAEKIWFDATLKFNTEVYDIMQKIIAEQKIGVLLNRNPTIAVGSILYLNIKSVKKDYTDNTISLSNLLDTILGADYDGDVLNLISIKDAETREVYKNIFSPIALLVNPNNAKFNTALNLERDQILGMNTLLLD